MRRVAKWVGIGLGSLVGILVIAGVVLFFIGGSRVHRSYDIDVAPIDIRSNAATLARGAHLVHAIGGCTGCHGDDLSGGLVFELPGIVTIHAPNLTPGVGGAGAIFTDDDWVRAIRHGVGADKRGLWVMPSEVFHNFTETDLGAVIAYLRTVPAVDTSPPRPSATFLGQILAGVGVFGEVVPAELIDHAATFDPAVPVDTSATYGRYLASVSHCLVCHGEDLAGGESPDPSSPPPPNITAAGRTMGWTDADLIRLLRTGNTPDGRVVDPDLMPWNDIYSKWTDAELQAIWQLVQSVPAVTP